MRGLAVALLLLLSSAAWAQASEAARMLLPGPASLVLEFGRWVVLNREQVYQVTVQGMGRTQAEAHDQALRLAVSQAVGAVILTENQVDLAQQEVRRAALVNHSSGIVDRFEILRTGQDTWGRVVIDMRVWVRRGRLADGLFGGQANTTAIQGPQVAATLASESNQRRSSGDLVQAGVQGWPERAVQVRVRRYNWQTAGRDFAHLLVDLELEIDRGWFSQFYHALNDANGIPKNNPCNWDWRRCDGLMVVNLSLRPGANGAKTVVAWTDSVNWTTVDRAIMADPISLRVELMSGSRSLYGQCFVSSQVRSDYQLNDWFNLVGYEGPARRFPWDPMPTGINVRSWARQPVSLQISNLSGDVIKNVDSVRVQAVKTANCS